MRKGLLLGLMAVTIAFLVTSGCEEFQAPVPENQEELVALGWDEWVAMDYAQANEYFEQAIDVEESYAPAYNGLGWSYLRTQELTTSISNFNIAKLLDANLIVAYVGSSTALMLNGDFTDSVNDGLYAVANWANYVFPSGKEYGPADDGHITIYDVYLVLALDYFSLLNMASCVDMIDEMREILGLGPYSGAMTWDAIAAELNYLAGQDD